MKLLANYKTLSEAIKEQDCECPVNAFTITQDGTQATVSVEGSSQYITLATSLIAGLLSPTGFTLLDQLYINNGPLSGLVPTGKTIGFDKTTGSVYYNVAGAWVKNSDNLPEVVVSLLPAPDIDPQFGEKLFVSHSTLQMWVNKNDLWQLIPQGKTQRYRHNSANIFATGLGVQLVRSTSVLDVYIPEGVEIISMDIYMTAEQGATSALDINFRYMGGARTYNQDSSDNQSDILIARVKAFPIGNIPIDDYVQAENEAVVWSQQVLPNQILTVGTDTYATNYSGGGQYPSTIKIQF